MKSFIMSCLLLLLDYRVLDLPRSHPLPFRLQLTKKKPLYSLPEFLSLHQLNKQLNASHILKQLNRVFLRQHMIQELYKRTKSRSLLNHESLRLLLSEHSHMQRIQCKYNKV